MPTVDWLMQQYNKSELYFDDKNFPAVYCFYDVTDKLVYIGKSKNLALRISEHFSSHYGGHLGSDCYKWVNRIMYAKCSNDADALIAETCMIASYSDVEFNTDKFMAIPTLIDCNNVLNKLVWEEYICFNKPLMKDMLSMSGDECVKYVEQKYDEYVRQNKDNQSFLNIFELFGRKFYDNNVREKYCYVISHMNIPDFDKKLVKPVKDVLLRSIRFKGTRKASDFRRYGDISRAFVENYNMPYSVISMFVDKQYVSLLPEYAWGKIDIIYEEEQKRKDRKDTKSSVVNFEATEKMNTKNVIKSVYQQGKSAIDYELSTIDDALLKAVMRKGCKHT